MRALLDTHALLFWLDGDRRLSGGARRVIRDETNEILVSAASAWEIGTKVRLGKLPGAVAVAEDLPGCIASQGFAPLEISVRHAQLAGQLPADHRDPFDRMLAAQAQIEGIPIVSNDAALDAFGIRRLW